MRNLTQADVVHLDKLMDSFNWDEVHRVMTLLEWKWLGKIPDKFYMMGTVTDLFNTMVKQKAFNSSTGGFHLQWDGTTLHLSFQIEYKRLSI